MPASAPSPRSSGLLSAHESTFTGRLLRPLPLPLLRLFLNRIVRHIAQMHPGLFTRLSGHTHKRFLIIPVNLPFSFVLHPDPAAPQMEIYRGTPDLSCEARISGSFMNLLKLIDGRMDGDALFFSRDLKIEGDVEAIVCLRNALDDIDGSVAQDIANQFGPLGRAVLSFLRRLEV